MSEKEQKSRTGQIEEFAAPEDILLQDKFQPLKKMSKTALKGECEVWRRMWSWLPTEVKYYVARTGKTLAVTGRNYKRKIGTLLATSWDITDLELGIYEKEYDQSDGKYYWEKKIVKIRTGGLIDIQWIHSRVEEELLLAKAEEEVEEAYPTVDAHEKPAEGEPTSKPVSEV